MDVLCFNMSLTHRPTDNGTPQAESVGVVLKASTARAMGWHQ